jgi:hypothetical protein
MRTKIQELQAQIAITQLDNWLDQFESWWTAVEVGDTNLEEMHHNLLVLVEEENYRVTKQMNELVGE